MNHTTSGRHRRVEDAERFRLRSASTIALASAVPAAAPAAVVTGSFAVSALIAVGTVVGVGLAGLVI
ncbi:hypothetical protein ACFYVR_12840 [Rhodococcus sp. NPDC003318]|uniref:hypothetical protein n=1 Tax=Rhodococcus sp. NPDC003318 TaxID=3364503 RepID=UPI0036B8E3DC